MPPDWKKDWKKAEKEALDELMAAGLKANLVPGSGSGPLRKGDVRSKDLLIEQKATGKKSFSITINMLKKIEKQAGEQDRVGLLRITLGESEESFYVIPAYLFVEWLSKLARGGHVT